MNNLKFFPKNFDSKEKGLSGIINLGNTCFMNSGLQCISLTVPLTRYFVTGEFLEDINTETDEFKLCKEYIRVLIGMWEDNCIVSPVSFRKHLETFHNAYTGFRQHDSHELLVRLIDVLHIACSYKAEISYSGEPISDYDNMKIEALKVWANHFKDQYSTIIDLFYGQFNSSMICNLCDHIYHSYDPFCSLSLQVTKTTTTIYDCLDAFSSKEVLDEDNKWRCDKCQQLSQATKKIVIWKTPKILILSFKRFDYMNNKNNIFVDYPVKGLNINKYVFNSNNSIYDLFAVSIHTGSANYGHYTSYGLNTDGNWYKFDDQNVTMLWDKEKDQLTPVEQKVVTQYAYVLMYRRRDVDFD